MKHRYDPNDSEDRIAIENYGAHWSRFDWFLFYLIMWMMIAIAAPFDWCGKLLRLTWRR